MGRKPQKIKNISIRWQLIAAVLLLQIPFCIFFTVHSQRTIDRINNQMAKAQQDVLYTFRESLHEQISAAQDFLYVRCWGNPDFQEAAAMADQKQAELKTQTVQNFGQITLDGNSNLNLAAVYFPKSGLLWWEGSSGEQDAQMQESVKSWCKDPEIVNNGWHLVWLDDRAYFVAVSENCGGCALIAMNLYDIATNARVYSSLSASVVLRKDDVLLSDARWARSHTRVLPAHSSPSSEWYFSEDETDGQRYQVVEIPFADMTLCMGTVYQYDWSWLYWQSIALVVIFIATLLLGIVYLSRVFFDPLTDLVEIMHTISDGKQPNIQLPRQSREFCYISDTFSQMLDTLKKEKFATYENQLKAQQMEMSALRLQIRRHFFLNCLKNIYAAANLGDIEVVKQMSLLLSTNLRYTLDFHEKAVPLAKELEMCRSYIQLQGLGQRLPPRLTVEVPEGLNDFLIPPVSLLSVLENCCKYGMRQDIPLEVEITAQNRRIDDQEYVCIAVSDNGLGYPPEVLRRLNNGLQGMQEEGHVGLVNTLSRFRMLYGKECEVLFSNRSGAHSEWIIHRQKQEEQA